MKAKDILKKGDLYCGIIEVGEYSLLLTNAVSKKKDVDFKTPRMWYMTKAVKRAGWKII